MHRGKRAKKKQPATKSFMLDQIEIFEPDVNGNKKENNIYDAAVSLQMAL